MTIIQRYLIGFLCAFMSVLGFAATFVSAGVLTKNHAVSPLVLAMLRFLIAGGSMLIVGMTIPSVRKSLLNVSKRDWLKILWIGPIGTAIMAWTVFEGCQRVCTDNASMADAITPLGIFIISTIRTKHVSLLEFTGLIFGFAGALFVIQVLGPGGLNLSAYTLGDLYILISAIVWGAYAVFGRDIIDRIGVYTFTTWSMLTGFVFMLIVFLALIPFRDAAFASSTVSRVFMVFPTTFNDWMLVLFQGYFSTLMPFLLWNAAQRYLPLSVLAMTTYFTPIMAVGLAWFFTKETTSSWQLFGSILVCGAALIETGRRHE